MTTKVVYLTTGSGTTTLPGDFGAPWTFEVISGAGGADTHTIGAKGGGGGGYAKTSSGDAGAPTLSAGQTLNYQIGAGGTGGDGTGGTSGGDSWIGGTNLATSFVGASGAQGGLPWTTLTATQNYALGGVGTTGTVKHNGGKGGPFYMNVSSTGGGGGAGPGGNENAVGARQNRRIKSLWWHSGNSDGFDGRAQ